jgi:hypothetical protein
MDEMFSKLPYLVFAQVAVSLVVAFLKLFWPLEGQGAQGVVGLISLVCTLIVAQVIAPPQNGAEWLQVVFVALALATGAIGSNQVLKKMVVKP